MRSIIFWVGICVLFFSCHPFDRDRGLNIFHYNQTSGISSLDPAFASVQSNIWAVNQLFNGLVQTDSNMNVVPCIARQWSISDDGLTYTFYLRQDVFFHNNIVFKNGMGRKVIAADVSYSFSRLIDSTLASPGAWIFRGKIDSSQAFSAPNDSTFILKLSKPFMPMLGVLCMPYCCIVPHEAIEYYGKDFRNHPVGTGPFVFKSWIENEALTMLRNPNYFETENGKQLPFIDGVYVSFIDNKIGEFLQFRNGNLDFVSDVDAGMRNDLLTADGNLNPMYQKNIRLQKSDYLNTEYIGFNLMDSNSVLQNVLVRKAMSFAIDREALVSFIRNHIGIAGENGFVANGLSNYDNKKTIGYNYNPVLAKKYLTDAGFKNGEGLPVISLKCSSTQEAICNFLAAAWKEIGVQVKVEVLQSKALNQEERKGTVQMFRASWYADYADAESFLSVFYSGNPAPPNYTRFANETFDEFYLKSISEVNDSIRQKINLEMDHLVMENCPVIVLYYDEVLRFVNPRITGFPNNAINLLDLRRVKKMN